MNSRYKIDMQWNGNTESAKKEIEKTTLKLTSSLEKAECVSSILLQISISVELLLTLRVLFWLEERGILPSKEW